MRGEKELIEKQILWSFYSQYLPLKERREER
jgi:hypothetical protein